MSNKLTAADVQAVFKRCAPRGTQILPAAASIPGSERAFATRSNASAPSDQLFDSNGHRCVTFIIRTHCRRYQHMLDRTVPHVAARWAGLAGLVALYALRVYFAKGWFIVTYGLGIFWLNMFIGFISPQVRPLRFDRFRAVTRRVCAQNTPVKSAHLIRLDTRHASQALVCRSTRMPAARAARCCRSRAAARSSSRSTARCPSSASGAWAGRALDPQ